MLVTHRHSAPYKRRKIFKNFPATAQAGHHLTGTGTHFECTTAPYLSSGISLGIHPAFCYLLMIIHIFRQDVKMILRVPPLKKA